MILAGMLMFLVNYWRFKLAVGTNPELPSVPSDDFHFFTLGFFPALVAFKDTLTRSHKEEFRN
jgi:hypothetical protein